MCPNHFWLQVHLSTDVLYNIWIIFFSSLTFCPICRQSICISTSHYHPSNGTVLFPLWPIHQNLKETRETKGGKKEGEKWCLNFSLILLLYHNFKTSCSCAFLTFGHPSLRIITWKSSLIDGRVGPKWIKVTWFVMSLGSILLNHQNFDCFCRLYIKSLLLA